MLSAVAAALPCAWRNPGRRGHGSSRRSGERDDAGGGNLSELNDDQFFVIASWTFEYPPVVSRLVRLDPGEHHIGSAAGTRGSQDDLCLSRRLKLHHRGGPPRTQRDGIRNHGHWTLRPRRNERQAQSFQLALE